MRPRAWLWTSRGAAARFDVRHDPERPFEIHTSQARMTALGTSFSVDHSGDGSELRVFSGKVGLEAASGERLVVPARQWAMVGASAITGHGTFDPAAGDWQSDWLDAQVMPLGRAVERLGRYSAAPLRLGQARFAALTFSRSVIQLGNFSKALATLRALAASSSSGSSPAVQKDNTPRKAKARCLAKAGSA